MKRSILDKIIAALAEEENGLWIRELARRTGLKPMTVSYYITHNPQFFEEETVEGKNKPLFRLIRLRKGALSRTGVLLARILKSHEE